MTTALDRLVAAYYNSSPVTGGNPGGLGGGGHKVNFPAALLDFATVATAVNQAMLDAATVSSQAATVNTQYNYVLANAGFVFGSKSTKASAATCDIGTSTTRFVEITGTTTITALGSTAVTTNPVYLVRFAGALTLTHNAVSLILPGAANIATAAGDVALCQYLGSGNWQVLSYDRASGLPVVNPTVVDTAFGAESTLASAATTNLGSATARAVQVTGTTTITAFGSSALTTNPHYLVRFAGALTLTHNAVSLILPGAANIVTAAGDVALCQYLGSGNWQVLDFTRASGLAVVSPVDTAFGAESTLASAATTNLGSATARAVQVTGTTTITALGSSAVTTNPHYLVRFAGALTLTHNATSLILPGAANIATAAGDVALCQYLGSGNWQVLSYSRADGKPLASELATTAEAKAGTVTDKNMTPAQVAERVLQAAPIAAMSNMKGLQASSGLTILAVTADAVLVATTGGILRKITALNVSLDVSANGAVNRLDTGFVAASTWYYLWAISDGTTDGVLASLSATAPTMPSGYTFKARICSFVTDASAAVWPILLRGRTGLCRGHYINVAGNRPPTIVSTSTGSVTTPTWTPFTVQGASVPPTATAISLTTALATGQIMVAPNSSYGAWNSTTNAPWWSTNVTGAMGREMPLESGTISVASSGSNLLWCNGWEELL